MILGRALSDAAVKLAASDVELPERTAHWLWQHVSGMQTHEILAGLRQEVDDEALARFGALVLRRARREPLQYILGETEFCGLLFHTDARALIPRPETEILVHAAITDISARLATGVYTETTPLTICDVGTGSGAIAVTVARKLLDTGVSQGWRVIGIDDSADALSLAEQNAIGCGVQQHVLWQQGDLISPLTDEKIDVLLANLPYIPEGDLPDMQPEVSRYEPAMALFAGIDGLDLYRRLIAQMISLPVLAPKAWMIWEIGHDQCAAVLRMIRNAWPTSETTVIPDQQGIERFVCTRFTSLLD
ncbi:MAG: peptide chain release factor N(5)-glutamine methyltransferase [Firmicutes bacterium]|nr:peptide chain release factor N(5)-glutamine methyltransferase [Bacillota bacterium]